MKYIQSKSILSKLKITSYDPFGITYNMNLYRGCQHQCIYCDSRSDCYHIGDFSEIHVKKNAIELLKKELPSKKTIGTIGTGSMNDPYMPVEKKYQLTRQALELIKRYRFPIHIITKSDLITRDINLLRDISKIYAAVSISITTSNDEFSKIIEPAAPLSSARFQAIETLAKNGIYCGVLISPVLPFITDSKKNIESLLKMAKNAGANYVLMWPGMTQRQGQREWYYDQLDKHFPGLKEKYTQTFGNNYNCSSPDATELYCLYEKMCFDFRLDTKMKFYKPLDPQISLF